MAGVDIGGDESVMWCAEGDNVRKDKSLKHEKHGDFGWKQAGVDEANGDFTITIDLTANPAELFQCMRDSISQAERTLTPVTFKLPIEYGHHDQIQIRWDSDLTNPHAVKKAAAQTAPAASVKMASQKRPVRSAKTKASAKSSKKPKGKSKSSKKR